MAKKKDPRTRKMTASMFRERIRRGCPVCGKALVAVPRWEIDLFSGEPEYAGTYIKCPDSYTSESTHKYYMGNFGGKGLIREANVGTPIPIPENIKRAQKRAAAGFKHSSKIDLKHLMTMANPKRKK